MQVVAGPYGDELEVSFALVLPEGDPDWDGVPDHGSTRLPFDAQWRRLSGLDEPATYAPRVASEVMRALGDHLVQHQHGGRLARERAEWRDAARAKLPDRATQQQLLVQALSGLGTVVQQAEDRFELRLGDGAEDDPDADPAEPDALGEAPRVIAVVVTPEQWEHVLVEEGDDELELHLGETLAHPDPDERFVVFHDGALHRSTREKLPPVRGRARERALARRRAERPMGPGDGWFAYRPGSDDPRRPRPPS